MIDYFPVVRFLNPINFQCWRFVDQIEKSREGLAQANAAATTMTDVIDPLQFGRKFFFVDKFRVLPVDRMSGWGLDSALANWMTAHIERGRVDCMAVERNLFRKTRDFRVFTMSAVFDLILGSAGARL